MGKAFEALDVLGEGPIGLAGLSARLGVAKPSAFRLLHTLEALGRVAKDTEGRFTRNRHLRIPREILRALADEFRETVSMAALVDNHSEVIAVVDSPHLMRMGNTVGRIVPPHASSLGKAITAFQTAPMRELLVRAYGLPGITEHTITGEIEVRREFEKIRRLGFAEDREESALGGICFAAPILNGEHAVAAISMSMPKERVGSERKITLALRAAAAKISESGV